MEARNIGANTSERTGDVMEVTASRQALRFLRELAWEKGNIVRAKLFDDIYNLSLEHKLAVMPNTALIFRKAFVKTGYHN
jgi:hypothetical protein